MGALMDICLIPARIGSTRFPAKPLAMVAGVPMIERVAGIAAQVFGHENTFVATDSLAIAELVESAGFRSVMVEDDVPTGTDRISLAAAKLPRATRYFNLQGDEPVLDVEDLRSFRNFSIASGAEVTNAFLPSTNFERASSPNSIKLAISGQNRLIFASRARIPHGGSESDDSGFNLQVCMYSFSFEALTWYWSQPRGPLEIRENIEILRFIEAGISVEMFEASNDSHPVDVPDDVLVVEEILKRQKPLQ